jgi:O-antigen/teichoic acid export membrane protein
MTSDRIWIFSAAAFSRVSNFITNVILARYGGPAVFGTYSATLSTATAMVQPVVWSLSTSATLETRRAPDANARRAVTVAHVYWSLLIAGICGIAFVGLQYGTDLSGDGSVHDALGTLTGLIVVVSMLLTAALQGALHGTGVYKPVAARMVGVAFISVLVAVPAVLLLKLVGALAALSIQYVLIPAALAHLAKPCARERDRVRRAFAAARGQLIQSMPNVVATFVSSAATWLTTIFLVKRSYGISGVGVFAVGLSWLTIEMIAVSAWGGLSLRTISEAQASSAHDFRLAIRRVLVKEVCFTGAIALLVCLCAVPLSHVYEMANTPLPTILRLNSLTAVAMAATVTFERSMFCLGQQRSWLWARVIGSLLTLGLAGWLLPIRIEYGAVALFAGQAGTVVLCALHLWRTRSDKPAPTRTGG